MSKAIFHFCLFEYKFISLKVTTIQGIASINRCPMLFPPLHKRNYDRIVVPFHGVLLNL